MEKTDIEGRRKNHPEAEVIHDPDPGPVSDGIVVEAVTESGLDPEAETKNAVQGLVQGQNQGTGIRLGAEARVKVEVVKERRELKNLAGTVEVEVERHLAHLLLGVEIQQWMHRKHWPEGWKEQRNCKSNERKN